MLGFLVLQSPAVLFAQFIDEDSGLAPVDSGEWTLPVRLGIYATIVIVAFCFYLLAGYRIMLTRDGIWPSTLYGWCLGLFLATSILVLWWLFGDKWIQSGGDPIRAYGPQILIVTAAVVALALSVLLFRSRGGKQA